MGFDASGTGGEVLVGYQRAARLGAWHVSAERTDWGRVEAELLDVDDWWIAQPLTQIRLFTRTAVWVWTVFEPIRSNAWQVHGAPQIEMRTDV
jgi:hypothetical protein